RHEEAVKAYEAAQKLFPEDTDAAKGLASAQTALEGEKLKVDFAKFMDEGKTALADKKFAAAVAAYESALRLVPDDPSATTALTLAREEMTAADAPPEKGRDPKEFLIVGAQPKDKEKPKEEGGIPTEIDGKTFAQWKADIRHPDASTRQHAIRVIVRFGP